MAQTHKSQEQAEQKHADEVEAERLNQIEHQNPTHPADVAVQSDREHEQDPPAE